MERCLPIYNKMKNSHRTVRILLYLYKTNIHTDTYTHKHLFVYLQKVSGRTHTKPLTVVTPRKQGVAQAEKLVFYNSKWFDFLKEVYIKFTIKTYKNDNLWIERYLFYVYASFSKVVLRIHLKSYYYCFTFMLALTYK